MCGRFALFTPPARVAKYFDAVLDGETDPEKRPSWNVAPTDEVLGVRDRPGTDGAAPQRLVMSFRWGLVPWWSDDPTSGGRLFNARGESVDTKPAFRDAFARRRIIVPADGFYEWHRGPDGRKQAYYFTRADGAPLAFAGLAERWRPKGAPQGTPFLRSCTIITTSAGDDMAGIHDRMPVVLQPSTFDLWLDPSDEDTEALRGLLRPSLSGTLTHRLVSGRVGNVRNNDPELIEPEAEPE